MRPIESTELILNSDQSIYHLHLRPGEVAETIITVGDQQRVENISKHFDSIEFKRQSREFKTCTGRIGSKRLTVISTGIGTDNIEIVLNELDALFNVDFENRTVNTDTKRLKIIRLGTSGSISEEIPTDTILVSGSAFGLGDLGMHYNIFESQELERMGNQIADELQVPMKMVYGASANQELVNIFNKHFRIGKTYTASGFYHPQGRKIRVESPAMISGSFSLEKLSELGFTNIEMETAGIYAIANSLGHHAVSVNAILANRVTKQFSNNPMQTVETMVEQALEIIVTL